MAARSPAHSRTRSMSRAPSRGPEPIVVELPPKDLPPIYVDAGPARPRSRGVPAAPGLSGGRGMFKRLIVACDGTWLNSDNGMLNGKLSVPSNVTRMSRAIKAVSQDGVPQIVNYHNGVGTEGGIINRVVGGTTGEGLSDSVREAYSFLANNYHPGDEIFLIGFSRGAFTARSIAGFIGEIGLLTKKGLNTLPEVFKDVQHQKDPKYIPKNPNSPFPNKPSANDPRYAEELERRGLTRLDIPIKAIGVWDTVGSLGTPRVGWLTKVGLQSAESKEMSFYDTKLSNCIENAFQALALDEKRSAFSPAVWEKPDGNRTTLRQVWFPGVHSNVGGGYDDQELANITLAWMMDQLVPFIDMRHDYLLEQADESDRYYRRDRQEIRPWSFGELYNSMTGLYALGGGTFRTPGLYHAVDPFSGRTTDRPLQRTNEYIHPSVRTRYRLSGPGVADKGLYECRALTDNYKLVVNYTSPGGEPDVHWKLKFKDSGGMRILPEAPLWTLEKELCKRDPRTYDYVKRPPASGGSGAKRKSRKERPVSASFAESPRPNGRVPRGGRTSYVDEGARGTGGRSFVDDGVEYGGAGGGGGRVSGRSVVMNERRRSKSRARSLDRETDIREEMPHRRPKDKTWWEGEREREREMERESRAGAGYRSPRRSSMRV